MERASKRSKRKLSAQRREEDIKRGVEQEIYRRTHLEKSVKSVTTMYNWAVQHEKVRLEFGINSEGEYVPIFWDIEHDCAIRDIHAFMKKMIELDNAK